MAGHFGGSCGLLRVGVRAGRESARYFARVEESSEELCMLASPHVEESLEEEDSSKEDKQSFAPRKIINHSDSPRQICT